MPLGRAFHAVIRGFVFLPRNTARNVLFSLYEPGARAMIKVKRLRSADCVVGGFRYEADCTHERFAP
jgi:hypothetical protein